MDQEELLNKIEYIEFTNLLKIKNEIMHQRSMIEYEQGMLKRLSADSSERERLSGYISRRQKNIGQLLNLVFLEGISETTEQKIAMLDYRVNRDLPRVLQNLICGKYCYDWNIKDCQFDYSMVKQIPQVKDAYRNLFELKRLEEFDEFDQRFNDILNPIYFDIKRAAVLDSQYLPFLVDMIQHQLYDPNHLNCVPSHEPFYGGVEKLKIPNLTSSVLLDPRTNFNLLVNGVDLLKCMISSIAAGCQETGKLDPSFSLISKILKEKEVSIIDTTRFRGAVGEYRDDFYEGYISTFISDFRDCDLEAVQDLMTYLASDQGIQKQVMIAKYPSIRRDDEIDTYCDFIEKRRGTSVEGISKLKMLKLY